MDEKKRMQLNKTKIISLFIILLLSTGSLLPITLGNDNDRENNQFDETSDDLTIKKYSIHFSKPLIKTQDNKIEINLKEANTFIKEANNVIIPIYTKTIILPFGSKIIDIICTHSIENSIPLSIPNAPKSKEKNIPIQVIKEHDINSNQWYHIQTGGGIQNKNHAHFITITLYPLQYNEKENELRFTNHFNIQIHYKKPSSSSFENNNYDFLVITPNNFKESVQPLIDHKKNHGIKTKLVTTEEIYQDEYFTVDGNDKAEEIKRFLFNAFNQWGIDYVLLVGNVNKIPIRKTWMGTGEYQRTPLTDLYYADLCFGNGSFCSWDSNNNGYYGEKWHGTTDDLVDLYADIYIGRLACNNNFEVKTVVNKIIHYENNAKDSDWVHNCVMVGGDTHPTHNDYPEGEILIDEIADVTPTLHHLMLKTSEGTFNHQSLNDALNAGATFFCYAGHGFEIGLSTHPPNSEEWIDYNLLHLSGLRNKEKYPIVFFNACLTARLDYNLLNLIADMIYFSVPLPKLDKPDDITFPILFPCIAWTIVAQSNSGAVASIGATRISYGSIEEDGEITGGCSYITFKFFEAYSDGIFLSDMLFSAENDFLQNAIYKDPFIVEEMILLGDPTLKVGGYE